ncbi:MAG TPA: SpoIIE family protein phosphatase [Vicinamibacteria bacterium]|nr:SpoIIE family protein phosphatase [Vicinamibacteria bacterium]
MKKSRIVVADDQPDVRVALSLLLKAEGHVVEDVGSPAGLLEAAGRGADLVLMDLNYTRDTTSGAEGLDLLRRLRERHPLTPVIVMTAWGSVELAVEAMRQGARSFVLKPWDNGTLQQLVAAELGEARRRAMPGADAFGARDLAVARRVQAELLPRVKPALLTLDYAGLCLQAGAVGGDLYDFLPLAAGQVAFILADASGKGVGAALLMAHLQALLRSQAPRALDDLTGFLTDVNAQFYATTAPEHFATLFFAVYDDASRRLRSANCGHNPPVLVRADGSSLHLAPTAPAVGLIQDWPATAGDVRLAPDDLLVVYSDGVTEAGFNTGEEFGDARLVEAIRARRALPAGDLLPALVSTVEAFAGEAHADDLTLVALRGR